MKLKFIHDISTHWIHATQTRPRCS